MPPTHHRLASDLRSTFIALHLSDHPSIHISPHGRERWIALPQQSYAAFVWCGGGRWVEGCWNGSPKVRSSRPCCFFSARRLESPIFGPMNIKSIGRRRYGNGGDASSLRFGHSCPNASISVGFRRLEVGHRPEHSFGMVETDLCRFHAVSVFGESFRKSARF